MEDTPLFTQDFLSWINVDIVDGTWIKTLRPRPPEVVRFRFRCQIGSVRSLCALLPAGKRKSVVGLLLSRSLAEEYTEYTLEVKYIT